MRGLSALQAKQPVSGENVAIVSKKPSVRHKENSKQGECFTVPSQVVAIALICSDMLRDIVVAPCRRFVPLRGCMSGLLGLGIRGIRPS